MPSVFGSYSGYATAPAPLRLRVPAKCVQWSIKACETSSLPASANSWASGRQVEVAEKKTEIASVASPQAIQGTPSA